MPMPKLSLGLAISRPINVDSKGSAKLIRTKSGTDNSPVPPNGTFNNDMEQIEIANVFAEIAETLNLSLGGAYFFTKHFLVSLECDFFEGLGSYREYPVRGTVNWALGAEYYVLDSLAGRVGLFSNNANTQMVQVGATNQPAHVDLLGISTGLSLYRSGTSLTLSFSYQTGHGFGQAFADGTLIQRIRENKTGIYLSGSYQL
jgi:hypothetical protein